MATEGFDRVSSLLASILTELIQKAESAAASSTLSNVSSSASNVTLLAATSRQGASVFNDSTQALYLKEGATASTTSFTVKIPGGGLYEFPDPIYQGQVDGIWAAANGSARLTERT